MTLGRISSHTASEFESGAAQQLWSLYRIDLPRANEAKIEEALGFSDIKIGQEI